MTLANMRARGVLSLWVVCELCHHEGGVECGRLWGCHAGARLRPAHGLHRVRPNWQERQTQESLTGKQWQWRPRAKHQTRGLMVLCGRRHLGAARDHQVDNWVRRCLVPGLIPPPRHQSAALVWRNVILHDRTRNGGLLIGRIVNDADELRGRVLSRACPLM